MEKIFFEFNTYKNKTMVFLKYAILLEKKKSCILNHKTPKVSHPQKNLLTFFNFYPLNLEGTLPVARVQVAVLWRVKERVNEKSE